MNYWVNNGHSKKVTVVYSTNFLNLLYKNLSVFDLWNKFLENKEYIEMKKTNSELPMKTPLTWLCRGCSYKEVCDDS